ncbi:beta-galactosidase [Thozetella sp. PMI_491]|nr:beta-galactosidase [Thozetella sp. PMI_491]
MAIHAQSGFATFKALSIWLLVGLYFHAVLATAAPKPRGDLSTNSSRVRTSLNTGWKFQRFVENPDGLSYNVLKPWILPNANDFMRNGTLFPVPSGKAPGRCINFTQRTFNDSSWEAVNLPHDWAIKGPFGVPGGKAWLGNLPHNGIGWYRRTLSLDTKDFGKKIYLDIDGAMAFSAVYLNGVLVGGWPYGYASFRLDLTPYLTVGNGNILAIRLENGLKNSRWYPGAGLYRNLWKVVVDQTHVAQYGTFIDTPSVSSSSATVRLAVQVQHTGDSNHKFDVVTEIREAGSKSAVATFPSSSITLAGGSRGWVNGSVEVKNPKLWGPRPQQTPNMYTAVTTIMDGNNVIDQYETKFGIRSVAYDPNRGLLVNGQHVYIQGTANHADYGSLGTAFNYRAQERQLQTLQEMGTNAVRTAHNVPAPELLELADSMGFLVFNELFDAWIRKKNDDDFHLIFEDWHEPDLRAFVRRDRNHPSVIIWGVGNEIFEQAEPVGTALATELRDIIRGEDPNRPVSMGLNIVQPGNPTAEVLDILGLNYQGEGSGLSNNSNYPPFHEMYPDKMLFGSEIASTTSTRGTFMFPVTPDEVAILNGTTGIDPERLWVSAYDLYSESWATTQDKVFRKQDTYPYVAGGFVWTGWDYLGEPTPFTNEGRSSYFGIIDLAGFKKDRFWIYQSRWAPEVRSAHIIPHWTWPEREGLVTPVHVYSSADEAELFINGRSAGRQKKAKFTYRFRWNDVTYSAGELKVVTYKEGNEWATGVRKTVGIAAKLNMTADRTTIKSDGYDLSFVTVAVADKNGDTVPRANNTISFSISGPGEIVSTDNGDPTDMTAFPSATRNAFNGLALAIVRYKAGSSGTLTVFARSDDLEGGKVTIQSA